MKRMKNPVMKFFLTASLFILPATSINAAAPVAQEAPKPVAPVAESVRTGRKVTIDGGYGYSNGLARFAFAGFHLKPDWLVEAYYEEATTVFFGHSLVRGLRSKNFWSNIVYTNLGLMHRKTYGENQFLDTMTSAFTGKDTNYEIRYWDMGPELSVGSQWTWGGFHVGCDWVGVYWPLYVSRADLSLVEDGVKTEKTKNDLKPDPAARLLRLYMGLAI